MFLPGRWRPAHKAWQSADELTYRLWFSVIAGVGVRYLPAGHRKRSCFLLVDEIALKYLLFPTRPLQSGMNVSFALLLERRE